MKISPLVEYVGCYNLECVIYLLLSVESGDQHLILGGGDPNFLLKERRQSSQDLKSRLSSGLQIAFQLRERHPVLCVRFEQQGCFLAH